MIQSTTFDEGDPVRALEYASYADAALDRLGRPANIEVMFLFYKGTAMMEAGGATAAAAEPVFRRAVELARRSAPQYLDRALMGLAYLYEGQAKFADAVAVYRDAFKLVAPNDAGLHVFHERLAINLAFLGRGDEAEAEGRTAVALAEKILGEDNADRAVAHTSLAQVLSRSASNAKHWPKRESAPRCSRRSSANEHALRRDALARGLDPRRARGLRDRDAAARSRMQESSRSGLAMKQRTTRTACRRSR